jgi:hypothetical protein
MKTYPWTYLGAAAVIAVGFSPPAHANLFSDNFEALVVAETAKDAPQQSQPSPAAFSAIDGGYIEGGDPVVGDDAPPADRVRQAMFDALQSQGYSLNRGSPAVLLTYFWGVLRPDREEIRRPYGVKSNLNARLRLVGTEELSGEVENHILGREKGYGTDSDYSSPPILIGPTETVVQNARHARIFVIVSAFDYPSLSQQHQVKPLWRVKLSAQETSGDMNEVIPALIAAGAPYFGKNVQEPKIVQATLATHPGPASTAAEMLQPAPEANVDSQLVGSILNRERIEFSGVNPGNRN